METVYFVIIILVVLIVTSIKSNIEQRKKIRKRLEDEFVNPINREIDYEAYNNLKAYFYDKEKNCNNVIDDDTWDDLDMDSLYMEINNTNSSVGREYLYSMLRRPAVDMESIDEVDRLANEFKSDADARIKIQEEFVKLGYARNISIYFNLQNIIGFDIKSNVKHYVMQILLILAFYLMIFTRADIGVMALVAVLAVIIITYYQDKAKIEPYLNCVKLVVRLINASENISKMNIEFLEKYNKILSGCHLATKKIPKNTFLITSGNSMSGSIAEMLLDYIRILTHMDLIKFNNCVKLIKIHSHEIIQMYETLGYIESTIAIAAYRNKLPYWSVPKLAVGNAYEVEKLYHPLLENPVANSIKTNGCVLFTGSNASGKSTFLKSVAINALFSQTIATSISKGYKGDFYKIVSSMSHKDDIINGDSYYMVEIKALKRILDLSVTSDNKLLCFLDEVLRGTNTVERIAASTQILKCFGERGTMCFAATHDIELTKLLENHYENYHFDESFENDDVKYNYLLCKGPAVTRNAIRLLAQTGYDKELIDDANRMTKYFETNGSWY